MNQEESELTTPFQTTVTTKEVEEDYGSIEAFVFKGCQDDDWSAAEEIDTELIDVLPTRSEIAQQARINLRKYSILGSICLIISIIAVMVPISLTILRSDNDLKYASNYPSLSPSPFPSQFPTSLEFTEYVETFSQVSSMEDLLRTDSPRYKASRWIYDVDQSNRDVSDPRLIQGYIAVVFLLNFSWTWLV